MSEDNDLTGRTAEQDALDQALAATQNRAGGIVLLPGERGVGRS